MSDVNAEVTFVVGPLVEHFQPLLPAEHGAPVEKGHPGVGGPIMGLSSDYSSSASHCDRESWPIGNGGVVQDDQRIDVGVGSAGAVGDRSEQDDLRRIEGVHRRVQ